MKFIWSCYNNRVSYDVWIRKTRNLDDNCRNIFDISQDIQSLYYSENLPNNFYRIANRVSCKINKIINVVKK